ncbi:hypothetical protein [Psychrobacillus vulpis]|uniref:Uncharacterized protein n=1 Tax=Psychrobacillus vulpis TaxID=2325572 RepID=A0A544TT38_9BACI|nr:hypothetical protein [Psychrobacillus vulpis]TQR20611.1 hypothetical protein FG384_05800 [Psychrobacillus vulpis]
MHKKFIMIVLMIFISLNISWTAFAKDRPEDEFYSSLSQNEIKYKEYKNATMNIRKKLNGSELEKLDKGLGKFAFRSFVDYPPVDVYFYASIYEDNHMIVKKYAIYDLYGKFLNGGYVENLMVGTN